MWELWVAEGSELGGVPVVFGAVPATLGCEGRVVRAPAYERVLARVVVTADGCWFYTGKLDRDGYGLIGDAGRTKVAHRVVYEALVAPIPPGLTIDHVCHSANPDCLGGQSCQHRRCVNPAHLEPVTHAENMRRARRIQARTHCVN